MRTRASFEPKLAKRLATDLAMLASLAAHLPASAEAVVPDEARVMTGAELYMIFHGKTWKWENGADRMEDEGRVFRAWSQSDAEATWAEGRWSVNDRGELCLKADWHSRSGAARDKTCFSHRILGGTIHQKKEPADDWYVFRHAKPAKEDEFKRLVGEDLVAPRLPIIQELVNTQTQPEKTARPAAKANELGGLQ